MKSGEQKQIARTLTPRFGFLSATSSQPNSAITFDGKPIGVAPVAKRQIESGRHSIKIAAPFYHDYTEEFLVKDGETKSIAAELKPAFGSLSVTSQPEDGAAVYLDGEQKGTTPLTLNQVPSGSYILKLSKKLFGDAEENIAIADAQATVKVIKLSPNFAELTVEADQSAIIINEKKIGMNKYSGRVSPGRYNLRAERGELYYPDEKSVTLAVGEKKTVTLEPAGKFGEVYFFAAPQEAANAEIYIDDAKQGNAPLPLALLMGSYTLTAKKEGWLDYRQQLTVKEKEKLRISITMQTYAGSLEARRGKWGWAKWISAAAAAGAGAATYYFNSEANAYYDTYRNAVTSSAAAGSRTNADANAGYYKASSGVAIAAGVSFVVAWIVQTAL